MAELAHSPAVFWALFSLVGIAAFVIGWFTHRAYRTPFHVQDMDEYVRHNLPTEWEAYKRGISEGYEQGHRDCQEDPT